MKKEESRNFSITFILVVPIVFSLFFLLESFLSKLVTEWGLLGESIVFLLNKK